MFPEFEIYSEVLNIQKLKNVMLISYNNLERD